MNTGGSKYIRLLNHEGDLLLDIARDQNGLPILLLKILLEFFELLSVNVIQGRADLQR